jgi:cystathionine beta-lyase
VVTDEIHGDLVFSGGEHIPFATLAPEIAARTVTLTSATKAFNIPGLRCAVAHFGSQALQERYNALPRHIGGGIGLLGLYTTIAAWRESDPWLDEVRCYLEANRDFTAGFLAERLPEIVFHPPQATYLGWLDCSALELKPTPGTLFLRRGKVALSDGHYFGASFEQFARINFATSRSILGEVLERVESAVRQDAER